MCVPHAEWLTRNINSRAPIPHTPLWPSLPVATPCTDSIGHTITIATLNTRKHAHTAYFPCLDCIGQTFANLEAKALLAMLYMRYSFQYAGLQPEEQGEKSTHGMCGHPYR